MAFDIRTNAVYVRARTNNTWGNWEELVRNTGTWGISITGNAASTTNAANTQSGYGAKKITVGGNANTYYPVLITNHTSHFAWTLLNITRGYNEPAPDSWYTSTHRGGLTLTILSNGDSAWGGNHHIGTSKLNCIIDLSEEYTTMVGGVYVTTSGLLVLLRGGNADYWITSNNGQAVSASITLGTFTAADKKTYAARTSPDTANLDAMRWNNLWTIAQATALTSNAGNSNTPVYFSEGKPVATNNKLGAVNANGYWGMRGANNGDDWIRTTSAGLIPVQSGGRGGGHCGLGTSSWYFSYAYVDTYYANRYSTGHGYINGAATNGGINMILAGDDVWLGDCNIGGTLGLKSNNTSDAGISFYGSDGSSKGRLYYNGTGHSTVGLYNAVWNDYAEFRKSDTTEPGYVICPSYSGIAYKSNTRLQAGARIISDTFGFIVGECDEAKTPVGLAGRVLAYPYRNKSEYKIGDAVCSAPGGTVDIMTREEIMTYPDRIVGIVMKFQTMKSGNQLLLTKKTRATKPPRKQKLRAVSGQISNNFEWLSYYLAAKALTVFSKNK